MTKKPEVEILVVSNVASESINDLTRLLNQNRFYFTRIASSGSFLHLSTNTLLIGISEARYDDLMALLKRCCSKQRTHIATQTQMEAHFQPAQPLIIEAETGGATILTLPVEYFEQY